MGWITSKTGKVYLAACAGVTAILVARDLPRLLPGMTQVEMPVLRRHESWSNVRSVVLPPFGDKGDMPTLPTITVPADAVAVTTSGAEIEINSVFF